MALKGKYRDLRQAFDGPRAAQCMYKRCRDLIFFFLSRDMNSVSILCCYLSFQGFCLTTANMILFIHIYIRRLCNLFVENCLKYTANFNRSTVCLFLYTVRYHFSSYPLFIRKLRTSWPVKWVPSLNICSFTGYSFSSSKAMRRSSLKKS